jgi:hypothetical protein
LPGVHAVGVGGKETGGEPTGELAICVFVVDKRPLSDIPPEERIPPEIEGVKTDVVQEPVPEIKQIPGINPNRPQEDDSKHRPVRGGTQIKREGGPGYGTLGCICRVTGDPKKIVAVTNHHVLYPACPTAAGTERVGQPEGTDSCWGCTYDMIGKVLDSRCDPQVDIGLVQLDPGIEWLAEVEEIGYIRGIHTVTDEEAAPHTYQVRKRGMKSGLSGGTVRAVGVGGVINRRGVFYRAYTGAIRIAANPDPANPGATTGFSVGGDSGSAIVNASDEVVGILFGGGVSIDYAIPIQAVIDKWASGLPAARQINLEVARAARPNDVQTVPGSAMVALEEAARRPLAEEDAARLEEELRTTPLGAWYADLYHRHAREVLGLINGNRRVATVWHRSGASALLQSLVTAFARPGERIPAEIEGRPLVACLADVERILDRYGSPELKADLSTALPTAPDVAGLTYREALGRLQVAEPAPSLA